MVKERVLIVDDEKSMREFLSIMLKKEGYEVMAFERGEECVEYFKENPSRIAIVDLKMPGMGGIKLLTALKELNPDVTVIVITAYASVDSAIEAMKAGAYDYFTKPFNIDDIKLHLRRVVEWKRLERENVLLKKDFKARYGFNNLIGGSPKMLEIYEFIMSVAGTKTNILITGESGTGKELVARAIHNESPRREKPFVAVNCGAIPENLLESELFGYVKGAFTGAVSNKEGLSEMADGGTLFLDEITELPLNLQVKLLRFVQERNIRRVGGAQDIPLDVRLIAATNKNIDDEVKGGRFREDLFYRLNVIRIELPPLRERKEDIPKIARFFVEKHSGELKKDIKGVSEDALSCLMDYEYFGNVRELENAIERAVAVETKDYISKASLPPSIKDRKSMGAGLSIAPVSTCVSDIPSEGMDIERAVVEFEKNIIAEALKKTGGVKKKAADFLGITFRQLRHKLRKYNIS